jgi:hypothetical protein
LRHKLLALFLSFLFLFSSSTQAQEGGAGGGDPLLADTMANVWTVVGMMGAGAILGLSTLSFVEEPSEELDNIVTGGAIGIIIGVGIVGYMQATKSQELYEASAGAGPQASVAPSRWRYNFKATDATSSPLTTTSSQLSAQNSNLSKDAVLIPLHFTF